MKIHHACSKVISIYVVCTLSYTLPTYTMQCIAAITNIGWGLAYILYMCSYISLQETTHSLYISCPWVGVAVDTGIQYSDVTVHKCTQQINSEDIVLRCKIGRHAMLRTVTKRVYSLHCVDRYTVYDMHTAFMGCMGVVSLRIKER